MSVTNVKVDKNLANKTLKIAQNKYPLRGIEFYSEAVREVLIDFIKKNKRFLNQDPDQKTNISESEAAT